MRIGIIPKANIMFIGSSVKVKYTVIAEGLDCLSDAEPSLLIAFFYPDHFYLVSVPTGF